MTNYKNKNTITTANGTHQEEELTMYNTLVNVEELEAKYLGQTIKVNSLRKELKAICPFKEEFELVGEGVYHRTFYFIDALSTVVFIETNNGKVTQVMEAFSFGSLDDHSEEEALNERIKELDEKMYNQTIKEEKDMITVEEFVKVSEKYTGNGLLELGAVAGVPVFKLTNENGETTTLSHQEGETLWNAVEKPVAKQEVEVAEVVIEEQAVEVVEVPKVVETPVAGPRKIANNAEAVRGVNHIHDLIRRGSGNMHTLIKLLERFSSMQHISLKIQKGMVMHFFKVSPFFGVDTITFVVVRLGEDILRVRQGTLREFSTADKHSKFINAGIGNRQESVLALYDAFTGGRMTKEAREEVVASVKG